MLSVDSGALEHLIYIKRICILRDKTIFYEEWGYWLLSAENNPHRWPSRWKYWTINGRKFRFDCNACSSGQSIWKFHRAIPVRYQSYQADSQPRAVRWGGSLFGIWKVGLWKLWNAVAVYVLSCSELTLITVFTFPLGLTSSTTSRNLDFSFFLN